MIRFVKAKRVFQTVTVMWLIVALLLPAGIPPASAQAQPFLSVSLYDGATYSSGWTPGVTVTLTVDDPDTPTWLDFSFTQVANDEGDVRFRVNYEFSDHPGVVFTASDGVSTATLTLPLLTVDLASYTTERVTGSAAPGSIVDVYVSRPGEAWRAVTAGEDGRWTADFSIPGDEPGEENTLDLGYRTSLDVSMHIQEDSYVLFSGRLLLRIIANLNRNRVKGRSWEPGRMVTFTVDDPETALSPDISLTQPALPEPNNTDLSVIDFDLRGLIDLRPGLILTMSDGIYTKELVLENLTLDALDFDRDTISGTSDPEREVYISLWDGRNENIFSDHYGWADSAGNWTVDFSVPGDPFYEPAFDINEYTGGTVRLLDADTDVTRIVFDHTYFGSDLDDDGLLDLSDPCPGDPSNACNPQGSTAGVIDDLGGVLETENQSVTMQVPPGALDEPLTLAITDEGSGYEIASDLGETVVATSAAIQPHGATFAEAVTITLAWADADNNGVVDGTQLLENALYVFKDGVAISQVCSIDPGCDMVANTFSVQVSSLSHFALGVLAVAPPVIDSIQAPIDPLPVGSAVEVSAEVRNLGDNARLTWKWGDGTSTETTTLSATHVYSQAGMYTLNLTVSQPGFDPVETTYEYVVIYDPTGGFVTGGGWIATEQEKDFFALNVRYKKNSSLPEGMTGFKLQEAGLRLQSIAHDWLVVATNSSSAIYRGSGLVDEEYAPNGLPYKFMVWAVNGDLSGQADALRIKIWWVDALGFEQVVYDNSAPQTLGEGSIVVHKAK